MKTLSTLLILGCAQVLSANYYQGYDSDGYGYYNNGYQNGQGYQGQAYYQDGNSGYYYQEQPSPYQQAPKNPNDWSRADQRQYNNPNQVNTSNWDKGVNNQIAVDPNYKKDESKEIKYTENTYSQDAAATPEDKALNAKIREKLKGGLFSRGFDAIILRTSNGIVLITGAVDTNDDVVKVHDQVKAVDGVRDVNNQLTVKNKY